MKTYKKTVTAALLAATLLIGAATAFAAPPGSSIISMNMVKVGDAGNAADTGGSWHGAVSYEYQIGKYEVTNAQYVAFLNAVAKESDNHGLYLMGESDFYGITRSGSAGDYSYSVKSGYAALPMVYVTFYDAARFANWLTTGETESGLYTFDGDGKFVSSPDHATSNGWAIASEDEWYKAAYYKGGGTDAGYWKYATQSDTVPAKTTQANYFTAQGSSFSHPYMVDVDYYDDVTELITASAYGTYQQNGNLCELMDLPSGTTGNPWARGGSGCNSYGSDDLASSGRSQVSATWKINDTGFRVVWLTTVPEPGTYGVMAGAVALLGAVALRKRNRRA